jgi:hypothetical protein
MSFVSKKDHGALGNSCAAHGFGFLLHDGGDELKTMFVLQAEQVGREVARLADGQAELPIETGITAVNGLQLAEWTADAKRRTVRMMLPKFSGSSTPAHRPRTWLPGSSDPGGPAPACHRPSGT